MKNLIIICVAFGCLLHITSAVIWKDCGSKAGKIQSVKITNCDKTPVCNLKRGSNVTFTVAFTPNEMVTKATTVVHGVIKGIPIPFPISNPDACKNSGLKCPLKPNVPVVYHTSLSVKDAYPPIHCNVKWEVKDQKGIDLFCMFIPVHII